MTSWLPAVFIAALAVALIAIVVVVVRHRLGSDDPARLRGAGEPSVVGRGPSGQAGGPAAPDPAAVEAGMRRHIQVLQGVVGAFFGVLLVRLWGMQLLSSEDYSRRAELNRTREVSIRAPRGRILDRNDNVLVGNRSSMTLVASSGVADDTRVVRRLSNLLGMPDVAVRRAIQDASEGAQSQRTILIDVPEQAVAYVVEHPAQFPGVQVESRTVRSYPNGTLAAHLLGYAGSITQEELEAYAEDPDNHIDYVSGDIVGKSGVEYQYERVLQGVRGSRVVHVDANGNVTGVVSEIEPEQGSDVRLTIDLGIQQAAEEAIQTGLSVARHLEYEPTGGAVVVMDCKTGELLAMASWPTYDPNAFIGGISTELWEQLQAAEANTPLLNRAINGQYPSASTIKPFSALSALEHGQATQDSYYHCPGYWTGLGEPGMWCWEHAGHGDISLHTGITNSCDAVFYEIAKATYYSDEPEALQEMYRRWGLGSPTGIDLAGESSGRIPDAEWKWEWFSYLDDDEARTWHPGDTANMVIGQGDLLVTPLQLAYAYCGLARGGTQMRPHVLLDVLSSETQQSLSSTQQTVANDVTINASDVAFIHEAITGVISEVESIGQYFDGLPVQPMGKSGTAETSDEEGNTHAWFVAVAPADDPQYVVASLIEHGGGGGDVTTHVCRQVLGAIYGVEMTDPIALVTQNHVATRTQSAGVMD